MKHGLWGLILLAGCGAAGRAEYTEADHRQMVSADVETIFYVSLPERMTGKPVFSPNVLSLGGEKSADGKRVLEFKAKALGETEIKVGSDYSLRVRVTSASDRPGMRVHVR